MRLYQIFIFTGVFMCTSALLTGCTDKSTVENTQNFILPEGLKDCKIFKLNSGGAISTLMHVVRCPNSETTTTDSVGKTTQSVTLLEEQLQNAKLKEAALSKLSAEEKQVLGLKTQK